MKVAVAEFVNSQTKLEKVSEATGSETRSASCELSLFEDHIYIAMDTSGSDTLYCYKIKSSF